MTKPFLDLVKIKAPREIFGNPIKTVPHRADVVRLEKLIEHGGIYLDCDLLVHRDFDDLLDHSFVISQEGINAQEILSLSNAALLCEPSAPFAKRWYDSYRTFSGKIWAKHSTQLPLELAGKYPSELKVLPYNTFCWPTWHESHLKMMFEPGRPKIDKGIYGNHLWESHTWERYLENLSPRRVRKTDSNFGDWVRPLIVDLADDFAAPSPMKIAYAKVFHRIKHAKKGLVKFWMPNAPIPHP